MKYGKYEYERLFLLGDDCLVGREIESVKKIRDKYIENTKLRLRKVTENGETKFKLTQKKNLKPSRPGVLEINTLYLIKEEFDKIDVLVGSVVEKERLVIQVDQIRISIDKIVLDRGSLFIAEVEFDSELEMCTFLMPLGHIMEITGEEEYSGYEIAKEYSKYKQV